MPGNFVGAPFPVSAELRRSALADRDFFIDCIKPIPGWLYLPAALVILTLIGDQNRERVEGDILELGVYHGRFLALLYKTSQVLGRTVLGIDAGFDEEDAEAAMQHVRGNIERAAGETNRLILRAHDTLALTPQILKDFGIGWCSFISIDAGHEVHHLLNDLALTAPLLADGGIMAIDDAFNFTTPGAPEGVFRYFLGQSRGGGALGLGERSDLAPFAAMHGKLLVTTPSHHARYLALTQALIEALKTDFDFAANTAQESFMRAAQDVPTQLFGWRILPVAGNAKPPPPVPLPS